MKIVNPYNQAIPACVTFDYKGFVVSASTIFRPHSVYVLDPTTMEFISPEAGSIETAIQWIDEHEFFLHGYLKGSVPKRVIIKLPLTGEH